MRRETKYETTRKELLAIVHGLKQFRQYLLGRHFAIRTDHMALSWLRRMPEPMPQLAKSLTFIEQYDYEVLHTEAKRHGNADGLSRRPAERAESEAENAETEVPKVRVISETEGEVEVQVRENLPKRQQTDSDIGPIVRLRLVNSEMK